MSKPILNRTAPRRCRHQSDLVHLKIGMLDQTAAVTPADKVASFRVPLKGGPTELQTWFCDEAGKELCGAYYVYIRRLLTTPSAKIILDTDMSGANPPRLPQNQFTGTQTN